MCPGQLSLECPTLSTAELWREGAGEEKGVPHRVAGRVNWTFHLTQWRTGAPSPTHPCPPPLLHPHTLHYSHAGLLATPQRANNTPGSTSRPWLSLFPECFSPTFPTPAGLCSVKPSLIILFKVANHSPHLIFLYSVFCHLAFNAFCFFCWWLVSPPGIYAAPGQGSGVACSLLHAQLYECWAPFNQQCLLRPPAVLQTLAAQQDLRCTPQRWHSLAVQSLMPQASGGALPSIKNGSQKSGEDLGLPRAIPQPWNLLGARADHTSHFCCPIVPLGNLTAACAGLWQFTWA